jgi:hypothetical protein
MKDAILSTPGLYLYLLLVVTFLVAAFWKREAPPPVREARATALTSRWRHVGRANGPRTAGPFCDLQTTLSASYAARLEEAIRTIRAR